MPPPSRVYLVSPCDRPIPPRVIAQFRRLKRYVRVRTSPPVANDMQTDDVVVLDARGCRPEVLAPELPEPAGAAWFILFNTHQLLPAGWATTLHSPHVEPVVDEPQEIDSYERVVAVIALRQHERWERVIKAVLRELPSGLVGARKLVSALLGDPWEIRRPRDLARAVGLQRQELHDRCQKGGIRCTDHLITYVRGLALDYLVRAEHLRVSEARTLVGIRDPSNFRRQQGRTLYIPEAAG